MPLKLNVKMEIPGKPPREFLYEFDQDVITLGRDSRNDIQIPLTTVSRTHARILAEDKEYFIEDMRSTHGTLHNNKPLGQGGKKLLRDGDVIQVMHFRIAFQRVSDKPLNFASSERTEQLARQMVQEVLASMEDSSEQPRLRVMNGPDEGKCFELQDSLSEVVIGRASECDLAINDANISRRHALVRKDWSGITIEDLGSKNGVVINERKIEGAAALHDGDEIMLGAVRLTFIDPAASILGKLDNIPAFAELKTMGVDSLNDEDEGDDDDDEEEEEEEEEDGEDDGDEDFEPEGGEDDEDVELPFDGEGEGSAVVDGNAEIVEMPPSGNKVEIVLLVVVLLVVIVIAGGVVTFLLL